MRDIFYLSRQILRYRLERRPDAGEEAALAQGFLKYGSIYVVASPDTSKQEWAAKSFGVAVEDNSLRLFLEKEDAVQYACKINAVLFDGTPMVIKASQAMAKSLIADYSRKGFICKVWLCGKSPVRARVGVEPFTKDVKRESPSTIMEPDTPAPDPPILCRPSRRGRRSRSRRRKSQPRKICSWWMRCARCCQSPRQRSGRRLTPAAAT